MPKAALTLRIDFGPRRLGPGKVALLECIAREGSIAAAARSMKMSYRRAWELVEDINTTFGAPVLSTATGGSRGGGARLTPLGADVVALFRALERDAARAASPHLQALAGRLASAPIPE
ncbi:MAG: mopA 1 [Roseomonas sp.]|jgi:molybdate transport system regulatory protein|nr:mopA 1 [Roseomonas sp.]